MQTHKVGYLIGSLAKDSINRKLARALVRLAPAHLEMTEISFRELPLYSYDYDADFPPVARAFKEELAGVDAILFVTPEYNRSIPKKRHRLGEPPLRKELVHTQAFCCHRDIAGLDRNRGSATRTAQCSELLQFTADERPRSIHSIHSGADFRRRRSDGAIDRAVSP